LITCRIIPVTAGTYWRHCSRELRNRYPILRQAKIERFGSFMIFAKGSRQSTSMIDTPGVGSTFLHNTEKASLDQLFADSIETTRSVIIAARDRRLDQADRIEAESAAAQEAAQVLSEVQSALLRLA